MGTMKAAVVRAPNDLAWVDVPEPEPFGDRPVKLRIGAVGVCGSDVLRYAHGTAYHYPIVLGHEFSATVEQAPPDSRFRTGDKVAVFPLLPDHHDPLTGVGEWALGGNSTRTVDSDLPGTCGSFSHEIGFTIERGRSAAALEFAAM